MISAWTNPGETVLDIFSSSASTMIACANTNRNFIGCELDPEYHAKSLKRFADMCPLEAMQQRMLSD